VKQDQVDALEGVVKTLGEIIEILSGPAAPGEIDPRAINPVRRTLAAFNTPANRDAFAGYPYGKNARGKKRWLLEQNITTGSCARSHDQRSRLKLPAGLPKPDRTSFNLNQPFESASKVALNTWGPDATDVHLVVYSSAPEKCSEQYGSFPMTQLSCPPLM
jgi:hypothetical protein